MVNMIEMFRAENVWLYMTRQKKFSGTDIEKMYYDAAIRFGALCSLEAASKPVSDLSRPRPLDQDFVDTYNQIAKKLLECLITEKNVSLMEIGNDIYAYGKFNNGIAAICYGNFHVISGEHAIDGSELRDYANDNARIKIITDFFSCLNSLKNICSQDEMYSLFENNQKPKTIVRPI